MKTTRKLLSLLLALALALSCLPQMALPAHAADSSGKCGENLTWTFKEDNSELIISGTGKMTGWPIEDPPWQSFLGKIKRVTIEDGVTDVGEYAFYKCNSLLYVTFPDSVTSIGGRAFASCTYLRDLKLPRRLSSIGEFAFFQCNRINNIVIPEHMSSIDYGAFLDCSQLKSLTFLNDDCEIYDAENTLNDPPKTTIYGFKDAAAQAYANQYSYKFVELPTSGKCGGSLNWTFDRSAGELTVSGTGKMWDWYSDDHAPWYGFKEAIRKVSIKTGVESIGNFAFESCTELKSMRVPSSVTSIGEYAFIRCSGLTSVTIPDSVTSIGVGALYRCASLTSVAIPNSVTSISESLFSNCTSLNSITLPDSVTSIGSETFAVCTSLTSITIPDRVTTIGEDAFWDCTGLKSVTIPAAVKSIGNEAFIGCSSLTDITVDSGNVSYCDEDGILFSKDKTELICCPMTKTGKYRIPDSVKTIKGYAFDGCAGLTDVTIPDGVTEIGQAAFRDCTGLTSVTVPAGVEKLNSFIFDGCTGLTSATIPNGVTEIGQDSFSNCTALTSLTFPESVTSIVLFAIRNDPALTSITILNKDCKINNDIDTLNDPAVTTIIGYKGSTAEAYANKNGYKFEEAGPCAAGHAFDEWTRLEAPDCTKPGKETASCSRCGEKGTREIKPLGHDFKDGVCTRCGEKDPEPPLENPFADVKEGAYYYDPVLWAVSHTPQITNGTDPTHFSPDKTCTRAQVVTFLWRSMGQPEPSITDNPFTDVKDGQYYYKAVLWALEKGITTGSSATTFSPDTGCTRGQVVTFLHRAQGTPAPGSSVNPFSDVPAGQYYYDAVLWAVNHSPQITNGTSAVTFSPNATCTRGQIVTFLYRSMK